MKGYNPDNPFEYHIVVDEGEWDGSWDAAPPPPDYVVGTWKASLSQYIVAYLEIFEDGMAGLYKGDAESSQIYEIYKGFAAHTADGAGEIGMSMNFNLDWYARARARWTRCRKASKGPTPSDMYGKATGRFCMSKPTAARIRCSVKRN